MKVRCKVSVQDKHTNEWYVANKEYDLPKERAEEVVKAYNGKYFEFVEEATEEVKTEEKPKRVRKSTKK